MNARIKQLAQRAEQVLTQPQPHVPSPCLSVCVMKKSVFGAAVRLRPSARSGSA